jgi:urea carboxylase-associated protein 2
MGEPEGGTTATLTGARDHARAQADAATNTRRTVPSRSATDLPEGVGAETVLWDEVVDGGGYSSRLLPRAARLRITDLDGDGCVQLLVYNALATAERLNVMDTVKVQWQAYLGPGALLLSDMGRVLMTIVADTSTRHDCLCGASTRSANDRRYGDGGAWGPAPNARDLLCLGAAKHGLHRLDVGPNVNLFKGVPVAPDGSLGFDGAPVPGAHVELRAELPVIVIVSSTPHALDPRASYTASPVRFTAWQGPVPTADDPWRATTPERRRAFENTDEFLLGIAE